MSDWIFKKRDGAHGREWIIVGKMPGSCEYCNDLSASVNAVKFLAS